MKEKRHVSSLYWKSISSCSFSWPAPVSMHGLMGAACILSPLQDLSARSAANTHMHKHTTSSSHACMHACTDAWESCTQIHKHTCDSEHTHAGALPHAAIGLDVTVILSRGIHAAEQQYEGAMASYRSFL